MELFKNKQNEIIALLINLETDSKFPITKNLSGYTSAKEFMEAVKIGRTKFDQRVQADRIKTIKKLRKIYVPVTEIDRYFMDRNTLW